LIEINALSNVMNVKLVQTIEGEKDTYTLGLTHTLKKNQTASRE